MCYKCNIYDNNVFRNVRELRAKCMFSEKRIDKIKDILRQYKKVEISSLSSIFSVSEATIRRDLDKLELEGLIERTHGGAVSLEVEENVSFESAKEIPRLEEKRMIGLIASNLVDNNEVIFIGAGTTCHQFANQLRDKKNLTIVTNNVLIGTEYGNSKDINVILTGGNLLFTENSISLVGEFSNKMLQEIHVNKAFISVDGVDLNAGFTANHTELGLIWNSILGVSEEIIVLADYSKFGKKKFIKLGPIEVANKIITNVQVPAEYKEYSYEKGIPLYTSFDLKD